MSIAPLLMAAFYAGGVVPPPLIRSVTPQAIEVGAFYEGADVRVEGVAASGSKVIVTVTGSGSEKIFNQKARFGPIWLNSGKVRISGAPSLFLLFSAEPVRTMLKEDCASGIELTEAAVREQIHFEPPVKDPRVRTVLKSDFIALKKDEGTYDFAGSGITMGETSEPGTPYTLPFHWPKKAPPGEYRIHAYEVRDGAVAREAVATISVQPTGFPAWLGALAASRASLYGITAILIGALTGFGIDFLTTRLFGKKRPVGH